VHSRPPIRNGSPRGIDTLTALVTSSVATSIALSVRSSPSRQLVHAILVRARATFGSHIFGDMVGRTLDSDSETRGARESEAVMPHRHPGPRRPAFRSRPRR